MGFTGETTRSLPCCTFRGHACAREARACVCRLSLVNRWRQPGKAGRGTSSRRSRKQAQTSELQRPSAQGSPVSVGSSWTYLFPAGSFSLSSRDPNRSQQVPGGHLQGDFLSLHFLDHFLKDLVWCTKNYPDKNVGSIEKSPEILLLPQTVFCACGWARV